MMRNRFLIGVITAAVVSGTWLAVDSVTAQQAQAYRAPRTPDGKPNLNGIWQTMNTANWNIEAHPAAPSPVRELGASGAVPGGLGVVEGEIVTVGITKFAADQLTDVTFIELPAVGKAVKAGAEFGNIETVKAVSPLYSPVTGEIVAANTSLEADPNRITQDPFGECWLVRIRLAPGANLEHLLNEEAYKKQCASEAH